MFYYPTYYFGYNVSPYNIHVINDYETLAYKLTNNKKQHMILSIIIICGL